MAGRGWSAEIFVAEYRDLQATAMGVDRTGQYAILAGRKQLAIVDLDDPIEKVRRIARHSKYEVGVVQWNPHESHRDLFVVASNQSAEISCWLADKVESKGMLKGHTRVISDLDWSYFDADWVATCSVDTYIYLWDIRDTRKPAVSLSAVAGASQVKWNKKSCNLIATAHESDVRIWDQRKGTTPVQYIAAHLSKVHGLDWSPTQEWSLATSSQDCHVKLWDVCNPRKPESTISSGAPVWRARYTPFGEGLVTVVVPQLRRGDNSLLLWNINDVSVPVHTFVGHQDVILEFQWRKLGDDSKDFHLVTWSKDQSLRIWNIDSHLQKTCRHDLLNDSGNEADVDSAVEAMSNTSRDAPREQPPPVATATRAAAAVATVTSPGQTLQQEFSLVNMQIDNISIDSMDASTGSCTVTATSGKHVVKLVLGFPKSYPNKAAPSFTFVKPTSVDASARVKLMKVLRETSLQHVKNNRSCIEPCLRQLIATLDAITSKDSDNVESGSPYRQTIGQQVRATPMSTYGYRFQDSTVPFPRTSGARFSKYGMLVCFARPPALTKVPGAEVTPRSLSALAAYISQSIAVPPAPLFPPVSRSPNKEDRDRLSISNFYYPGERVRTKFKKRPMKQDLVSAAKSDKKCGSVIMYDITCLEPISKKLAELYTLDATDAAAMCTHNANAANTVGRKDLVQAWSLAALAASHVIRPNPDPDVEPFAHMPFGRKMLNSLLAHYAALRDVQTLAMLCCVFTQKPEPPADNYRPNRTKGDSESSYSPRRSKRKLSFKSSGSPYQTVHPCDTAIEGWPNLGPFTLRRTNSWSEPMEEFRFWSDMEDGETKQERERDAHNSQMRLLDPDVTAQHDAYKHAYANVLYYWKLHERRIEVLNFVSSATEQHRGVEVQTLCHHCGEKNATGGPQCSHCKHYAFRCSVCHVSVKGPANFCLACYHGGHTYHLMDWFAEQEVCPTGCGCRCLKASTMFADYTASAEH